MKRIPKSIKKYIRKEKARLRKQEGADVQTLKKAFFNYYKVKK